MAYPTKIVTCCYCGTRAALVLKGKSRHELACSSCGAPLHDLKMLPKDRSGETELFDGPRKPAAASRPLPYKPKKKRKKRKGLWRKVVEEAFDLLEDVLD